jgi:DNA-binding NtrC family response regulator
MKVLIIDDEQIIINVLKRVLEAHNFEVCFLNSGEQMFSKIEEFKPSIVFLDVKMQGGENGVELLRDLKKEYPDIKVVMMSGYTSRETIEEASNYGADVFLKKPFDNIFDLIDLVKAL